MIAGFSEANSSNLPHIDYDMIDVYYRSLTISGVQDVKTKRSSRQSYGDDAVGFVQIKRELSNCVVYARVTPEHKVRQQGYSVSVEVNENEEEIVSAQCHDCPASEGGCKHAVALLYWLLRRSDEPAVTSTVCYWKKSTLSKVGSLKAKEILSICKKTAPPLPPSTQDFLTDVVNKGVEKSSAGCLFTYYKTAPTLTEEVSLYHLMLKYRKTTSNVNVDDFLAFCKNMLNKDLCLKLYNETIGQSSNPLWFSARFGRITASKIHEAAKSKTFSGSLTEIILGASKCIQTEAMKRGLHLENKVLQVLEQQKKIKCRRAGVAIKPEYPIFAASPDAVTDTLCVEIKCPTNPKRIGLYIKDGVISKKAYAQLQLQMFLCDKKKGLFCVASPRFEINKEINIIEIDVDNTFCENIIAEAQAFWKTALFPRLAM